MFQNQIKSNILISTFRNNSKYFKRNINKFNLFDPDKFSLIRRNNLPIYLIKDPEIFLQERLVSTSELCISCHSGILVHSAGANNRKLIDIINEDEVLIQKCWAPLKNYKVIKKSSNQKKYDFRIILENIKKNLH